MIRMLVSAVLATIVVIAMILVGLSFFDEPVDNRRLRQGVEITMLPDHARLDVTEWLRETRGDLDDDDDDPLPRFPEVRPWEPERPDIVGFVQLVFTVDVDGNATDIRVFGAVPTGYYERQAIERVAARRWDPDIDDRGRPVPRRATEVVEFRLPHDAPRHVERDD